MVRMSQTLGGGPRRSLQQFGITKSLNFNRAKINVEVTEVLLEGERGTGGRPRLHDPVKIVPQYQLIDLYDMNEEIRF